MPTCRRRSGSRACLAACLCKSVALLVFASFASGIVASAQDACPHTYTVTSTAYTHDANVGDGVCADADDDCTLLAAVEEANADPCHDVITFDIPASGIQTIVADSTLSVTQPVTIDGTTQSDSTCGDLWSSTSPIWRVQIDFDHEGGGINLDSGSSGSIIKGLDITHSEFAGLTSQDDGNTIQCNYVHTNGTMGVEIYDTEYNTIGGVDAGDGNVLSDNEGFGIEIHGDNNSVVGNFVGTDATGTIAAANDVGIKLAEGVNSSIVAHNLVSGNASFHISIDGGGGGHTVTGNFVGTDVTGSVALGSGIGIAAGDTAGNTIGGTTAADRNVISGSLVGMFWVDSSLVGGAGGTTDNLVEGNFIGVGADGSTAVGNTYYGIVFLGPVRNTTVSENTIAYSGHAGITTFDPGFACDESGCGLLGDASTGNAFLGNSIHDNGGLGIDLAPAAGPEGTLGPGPNDLPFPVLDSALTGSTSTTVHGALSSLPSTPYRLEFFANGAADPTGYGQGQTYLGALDVTTDGAGDVTFTATGLAAAAPGNAITATASEDLGDGHFSTSEFGPDVPCGTTYVVTSSGDSSDAVVGDHVCQTASGDCTLRAALDEVNAGMGGDIITFNIDATDSGCDAVTHVCTIVPLSGLPTVRVANLTIDGSTQPNASCGDIWSGTLPTPTIFIDGESLSSSDNVLSINGAHALIRGLHIRGFSDGISIPLTVFAAHVTARCNWIESVADQSLGASGADGLVVGGPAAGDGNVITGAAAEGLAIYESDGPIVQGNVIWSNRNEGIFLGGVTNALVGGTSTSQAKNWVYSNGTSNNSPGIHITTRSGHGSSNNTVIGNYVGVNQDGSVGTLCNGYPDILDEGTSTTLTGNLTCPECPPLMDRCTCCQISGNSYGVVCADDSLPGVHFSDTSYCQELADEFGGGTALYVNTAARCDPQAAYGGVSAGTCPTPTP